MKIIQDIREIVEQFPENTKFYYSKWEAVPGFSSVLVLKPIDVADENPPYVLMNFSIDVGVQNNIGISQQSMVINLFLEFGAAHDIATCDVPGIFSQAYDALNTIMARLSIAPLKYIIKSPMRLQTFFGKYGSQIAGMTATLSIVAPNNFNLCCNGN